ncbi:hypothetical protein DCAR_0101554 [Daucus carota subsp. sativus]|uniref:Replication factor A C-terminal domain-containing protein n=1 Tax=Daucus carota subsp. sativus TaxID=79200 RepID=A0A166GGI3_DAUCS|nr:hypothetical protein DCAR_0101554 [Daucus carota subsp. sativus]
MEICATILTIPNPVVDLFSLKDLQPMEEDKRFLCDVCGVLKDPQDFRDYMNDSDEAKQQKKFTLTDGGVTLFDDMAKTFEEAIKNITTGNIVFILSSAKIGKFQGPKIRLLVEKEVTVTQLEKVVIEDMSIAAIKKMNKEAKVNCKVTVKKIEEHLNWFFYICTKCNLELDLIDGRYKCSGCSHFFLWLQKRFRVFALSCDKTGVLPLMLADREIRRLTGKMVFDVELDLTEDRDVETEGSHNVSKQKKLPAKPDKEKNANAGVISSQKPSFNREKAIKIKKNFRMHAFVPGKVFEEQETKLKDGNICIISNFTIKEYDTSKKFRCVNHDKQIILTNFTQIEKVDLEDGLVQRNMFDFYDLIQLENIADQNLYLTDVVGIIERDTPIGDLVNRFGKKQKQIKFNIVDGRTSVNVCFWDAMAEKFNEAIQCVEEYPTIIIIASAKITSWQPPRQTSKQYEVANVTATKFYINYDDESMAVLRKMYAQGKFSKYNFVNHVKQKDEKLALADVKKLPIQYAEKEIICKVKIKKVLETGVWFRYHCTSCYKIIEMKNGTLKCYRCSDRNVPEPYLRWEIHVQAEDKTGEINILLLDREIRTIFNLVVMDFDEEVIQNKKVPQIIKALENQHFAIKLEIKDSNILKQLGTYYATGIYACPTNETIAEEELLTPQSTFPTTVTQAASARISTAKSIQYGVQPC